MLKLTLVRLPCASVLMLMAPALGACTGEDGSTPNAGVPLSSFLTTDTIQLVERPGDSIGEILTGTELSSGDFLVVERYRPRVHLFGASGSLKASTGSGGEGPGEYRVVRSATQGPSGDLYLVDGDLGRITVLDPEDLAFKGIIEQPPVPPAGPIAVNDSGMLLAAFISRTGERLHMTAGDSVLWSASTVPSQIHDQPYWINFSDFLMAQVGSSFVAGTAILYPLQRVDQSGQVTNFGYPPPSFRQIPEVEAGAFPAGPRGSRFESFLGAFDVIGGLFGLGDDHLVVVHSSYRTHPLAFAIKYDHSVDIYRLSDTTKVAEDLRLPSGAHVIAGGTSLYVVISKPPSPWLVMRARLHP